MTDRPPIPGLVAAAERAVAAGARFIVSPHTDPELIRWCTSQDVPCFPGALSPTEIHLAWSAGASAVKLFPAAAVGVGYLRQIAGPFPDIPLVPTGGMSARRRETASRPVAWQWVWAAGSSGTATRPA